MVLLSDLPNNGDTTSRYVLGKEDVIRGGEERRPEHEANDPAISDLRAM